jgi:hypothetical protein
MRTGRNPDRCEHCRYNGVSGYDCSKRRRILIQQKRASDLFQSKSDRTFVDRRALHIEAQHGPINGAERLNAEERVDAVQRQCPAVDAG